MSDVLILCYHTISEWQHAMSVTPTRLERQLTRLVGKGYKGTTLSEAIIRPRPGRRLVVTFDDGFAQVYHRAFPILAELRLPATVFLVTDFVDGQRPLAWPDFDPRPTPALDELLPISWPQVRELSEGGWEIGSHTRTHPHLTRVDDETLVEEIEVSKKACEAHVNRPCRSIAYPFGAADSRVAEVARNAGYRAGVVMSPVCGDSSIQSMTRPRVSIYRNDGDGRFRLKTAPVMQSRIASAAIRRHHELQRHVALRPMRRTDGD
jgi:peptidoglycan/xylan/chitin deacetylase (PgdA/CDA1 family)